MTFVVDIIHNRTLSIFFSDHFKDKFVLIYILNVFMHFTRNGLQCVEKSHFFPKKTNHEFKLSRKSCQYFSVHNCLKVPR
jgi:hypothetical protein